MSSDFDRFTQTPRPYDGSVETRRRKTLVLDLDSTLVFTYLEQPESYSPHSSDWVKNIIVENDRTTVEYFTLVRPNAREFVERCSRYYDLYFFTAGDREYARPLFEKLFPSVPPTKCYYREDCTKQGEDNYVKDLARLGFDLTSTILLDDNAPENTVPRTNGFYCAQFVPREDDDGSREAVEAMLEDRTLEKYGDLLCSPLFLDPDDVRVPLRRFAELMDRELREG